jgi:enterochelin esterase-like enzyme
VLQFSEYDKAFTNIYCSQPILDINVEDSNRFIIRYPKFKEITHLIFSFDAENLFLQDKSSFGYCFEIENLLDGLEAESEHGYFLISSTSNKNRSKQYNPYRLNKDMNYAESHIENIFNNHLPEILEDYDINPNFVKKIVMGASMGGLMSLKTSIMFPAFNNVISLSPAFWFGFYELIEDLKNLNINSSINLTVGTNEGAIFNKHVSDLYPAEWDLDLTSNNKFYTSGVKKIYEQLLYSKIKTNFILKENGEHNENTWRVLLKDILLTL